MRARSYLYYFTSMVGNPRLTPPPAPARDAPTKMEAWYLETLRRWIAVKKEPPTVRQLALLCKKSLTATRSALLALEYKGYVERGEGMDRRFRVVGP